MAPGSYISNNCFTALGGTLSSYTWICLIINFLQTRSPPILPSLQKRVHQKQDAADGSLPKFDDDLESLAGFGAENKQSLAELFFEFFRYYGHEIDYEKNVMSVREGTLISKEGKGWHLLQNNRLCVEEPFNTSRNLGNTADDTSFRGVHMELRRAFKAVSEANFEQCCEQYEYPPEEERVWERPAPQRRPIIASTPQSSRGGRGGGRGGRGNYNRGSNGGRRSSSATHRPNNYRHGNSGMSPSELSMQAQQAQYLLHDHLYQQIQILQAQEQELRIQLQHQAMISGRAPPTVIQPHNLQLSASQQQQQQEASDESSRSRAGTVNHPPLTSSGRSQVGQNGSYAPMTAASSLQGSNTNPPSPSTPSASDVRRHHRHVSTANGSPGGSLRAQSQPARPMPSRAPQNISPYYTVVPSGDIPSAPKARHASGSPKRSNREGDKTFIPYAVPIMSRPAYMDEGRTPEYIGYYVGGSPRLQAYHQNAFGSPVAGHTGLTMQNGASSFARSAPDYRSPAVSPPRSSPDQTFAATSKMPPPHHKATSRPATNCQDRGPLIVDGSMTSNDHRRSSHEDGSEHFMDASQCTSPSDETCNTPASTSDGTSQDLQGHSSNESDFHGFYARQQQELQHQTHANGRDALGISNGAPNGHHTRLGNLSGRLQNLQIAHSDNSSDSSGKSSRGKYKYGNHFHAETDHDMPESPFSPSSEKFPHSNTSSVLSPVKEDLTPSPTAKRRSNGMNFERMNGNSAKPKAKTRQETLTHQNYAMALKERQIESLPQKPNGASQHGVGGYDTNNTNSGTGWQTTTKRRNKKGPKAHDPNQHIANGGEHPPADHSMRKGG